MFWLMAWVCRSGSCTFGPLVSAKRYPVNSPHPPELLKGDAIILASCGAKASTCAQLEATAKAAHQNGEDEPVFHAPA